jgi:hypothetical protein
MSNKLQGSESEPAAQRDEEDHVVHCVARAMMLFHSSCLSYDSGECCFGQSVFFNVPLSNANTIKQHLGTH